MRVAVPMLFVSLLATTSGAVAVEPRYGERLGRGVVAIRQEDGRVFVSWRLLGTDPDGLAFRVERAVDGGAWSKVSDQPITGATCFVDAGAPADQPVSYRVSPETDLKDAPAGGSFRVEPGARPYLAIPLQTPTGYTPNDVAPGDLDGDGAYDFVVKEELRGFDNSRRGVAPGSTKLAAYKGNGTFLWRVDLGKNIREGAHYTPFIVFDLDGDGRAEVAVRTAEGTVDGTGATLGDLDGDGRTDYVNREGLIMEGPEFLSIFDGLTGRELARTPYLPRGRVADWGDTYANRSDRFLMGVGYFDGSRPSVVMCRGYYTITTLAALNWRDGKLSTAWSFDTRRSSELKAYEGQGNHNLRIGDVDGDGRDEITYGAMALRHDGTPLYSTGLGHGDAIHLSDLDPDRPGLEVLDIHEHVRHQVGLEFRDARTGALIWGKPSPDVGRGLAIDLDPRHRGAECWASGPGLDALYNCKGEPIPGPKPRSCNFAVWWDGDPLRELLDRNQISKWDWNRGGEDRLLTAANCASNNGTKSNPALSADLLGDWREEVIWRATDRDELRLYTTTIPTLIRMPTLMHDPVYRLDVAMQNVGYNQPPQVSFFLGDGMAPPPRPNLRTDAPGPRP